MRLKILFNPLAGRGKTRAHIDEVIEYLTDCGSEVDTSSSRDPEHMTHLAEAASRNPEYDRVVICGGDGTLNLAVRRFDLEHGTLGLVPLGSGDDFAKTVGLPLNAKAACDVILQGVVKEFDVATANGVRYLGVAGLGFDSEVAVHANSVKYLRGSLVYLYSILRVLPRFKPRRVTMKIDGVERVEDIMFAAVGNTHRYGAGILIVPPARPDDGLLDLCLVGRCTKGELLKTLPKAYTGKHGDCRFVTFERGTSFEFSSEILLPVCADGEFIGHTPVAITLEPGKLRVCVPSR
jgi:lipid kinase, YegS/Rv2252/BmrU family